MCNTPFSGIALARKYPNLILSLFGGGFLGGMILGVDVFGSWGDLDISWENLLDFVIILI